MMLLLIEDVLRGRDHPSLRDEGLYYVSMVVLWLIY